jgi:ribosomal-protein-alanine N-acetyltransferase
MSERARVVPACASQAEPLAIVHAEAFPADGRWTAGAIAGLLAIPQCFGLLHPEGGMLLGRSAADEAEVLTLAVAPEARRRGIGAALLARAAGEARRRGARSLFLEVSETNAPARLLYGAAGFAEIGRRRRYYADGGDALVMKLTLRDHAEPEFG